MQITVAGTAVVYLKISVNEPLGFADFVRIAKGVSVIAKALLKVIGAFPKREM